MSRLERKNQGSGHSYLLDGVPVPGVTTVIGLLDKPALVAWAANTTAEYAGDHWDELAAKPISERVKELKASRFQKNRAAIVKGNRIHKLAEALARGLEVKVPLDIRSQVEAAARFLDRWELETVATEAPVGSAEWGYAGTLDWLCRSPRFGLALGDWKTGKGVYSEVALQLNAYAAADLMLASEEVSGPRGGKRTVWRDAPMPEVDSLLVAHVREDSVDMVPVRLDRMAFDVFCHLLEVYESWHKRVDWAFRDDPAHDPPVGDPIWPEDKPAGGEPPF